MIKIWDRVKNKVRACGWCKKSNVELFEDDLFDCDVCEDCARKIDDDEQENDDYLEQCAQRNGGYDL